jgi:hypothetical protein
MKYALIVALIWLCWTLAGCAPARTIATERTTHATVTSVIYRTDTLIKTVVGADESMLTILFECDSLMHAVPRQISGVQGGKNVLPPAIKTSGDTVFITCKVDSFDVYMAVKAQRQYESFSNNEKVNDVKTVEVAKPLRWWQITLMWFGVVFVLCVFATVWSEIKGLLGR